MLIYFVRHGQTPNNVENRFQSTSTPLSLHGESQALKVAERLKNIAIDEIWSSPMVRALQTAQAINEYQKKEIVEVPELAEIHRATSLQGKQMNDPSILPFLADIIWEKSDDPDFKYQDSETFTQFVQRTQKVVKKLETRARQVSKEHVVCVTTHGIFLNTIFLSILLGNTVEPEVYLRAVKRLKHENTGITLFRLEQKDWRILTFSDYAHL